MKSKVQKQQKWWLNKFLKLKVKTILFVRAKKTVKNYHNTIKLTDFSPKDHDWAKVNTTEFINRTAHQLEDFIDRYNKHQLLNEAIIPLNPSNNT